MTENLLQKIINLFDFSTSFAIKTRIAINYAKLVAMTGTLLHMISQLLLQ